MASYFQVCEDVISFIIHGLLEYLTDIIHPRGDVACLIYYLPSSWILFLYSSPEHITVASDSYAKLETFKYFGS